MLDRKIFGSFIAFLAVYALPGCGQTYPTTPVSGTVKLDGKPLAGVEVHFAPVVDVNAPGPPFCRATTNEAGYYTLRCDNNRSGAVIGNHSVMLRRATERSEGKDAPRPTAVPRVYQSFAQTPLQVDVKAGQEMYDLNLKSR